MCALCVYITVYYNERIKMDLAQVTSVVRKSVDAKEPATLCVIVCLEKVDKLYLLSGVMSLNRRKVHTRV